MEISAGKITDLEGPKATRSQDAEAWPLGPNEISGTAILCGNVSDGRDVFMPGAFADFSGHKTIFAFDHHNPTPKH